MNTPDNNSSSNSPGRIETVFCSICGGVGVLWMVVSFIYMVFSGQAFKDGVLQGIATIIAAPFVIYFIGKLFHWFGRILFGIVNSILNLE